MLSTSIPLFEWLALRIQRYNIPRLLCMSVKRAPKEGKRKNYIPVNSQHGVEPWLKLLTCSLCLGMVSSHHEHFMGWAGHFSRWESNSAWRPVKTQLALGQTVGAYLQSCTWAYNMKKGNRRVYNLSKHYILPGCQAVLGLFYTCIHKIVALLPVIRC